MINLANRLPAPGVSPSLTLSPTLARIPLTGGDDHGASVFNRSAATIDTAPTVNDCDIEHQLFNALTQVKVYTASVAMHMDREWRARLFAQLDDLHQLDSWDDADEPVAAASFASFLRFMLAVRPEQRPGLGIAHRGHLVASWIHGRDRLSIEFLPNDRAICVLTVYVVGEKAGSYERDSAAEETNILRIPQRLQSFGPERWFGAHRR